MGEEISKTVPDKSDISKEAEKKLSVNYIIFFTGVALIILSVVILITISESKSARIVYSILAIGTALTVSQIPVMMSIKLSNGITAGGAAAMAAMLYLFTPNISSPGSFLSNNRDSTEAGKSLPDCNNEKVSIAVFTGGNVDYTRAIKTFFLNSLQPQMNYLHKKCLYYEDYYVTNEINDSLLQAQFSQTNFDKRQFDYYVTIGTSASIGLKNYLESKNLEGLKMIFLGVSVPTSSGLVSTLTSRDEKTNITGVAYSGNYEKLPFKISQFYPKDTLVYIYNKMYLQDKQIAYELRGIPLERSGKLIIKELDRDPIKADFIDTNKVYFSWLTFENFFSTEKIEIIKQIKKIVSTTQTHAELGLVPLAVSSSDEEIGKAGTKLILQSLKDRNKNLGTFDVHIPEWKSYVNVPLARQVKLNIEAVENADRKYSTAPQW